MSRWTAEDFAQIAGAFRREMAGAIRRMVVKLSNGGTWQLLGHVLLDASKREAPQVENYPGIGIFGRPPLDSGNAEGIVINVAGANNPALIATRDEATRAACVGDVDDDEAGVYNSLARVHVKKNGTVEVRTHNGIAIRLLTVDDGTQLRAAIASAPIALGANGAAAIVTAADVNAAAAGGIQWPTGTQVLKGE